MSEATPDPVPVQTLNYSRDLPISRTRWRLWASVVLALTGLGLIGLGGCFLIGILVLIYPAMAFGATSATPVWSWGTSLFATALALLAAACFSAAAWILWTTVRRMLQSF